MTTPLDGVLARFDASAAPVFAWLCRLVGGDMRYAESLFTDTFVALRNADPTELECLATAYRFVSATTSASDPSDGIGSLPLRQRALLDLALVQHRSPDEITAVLGVAVADVPAALAEAQRAADDAGVFGAVADALRTNEHWLDDTARARTLDAITNTDHRPASTPATSRRWVAVVAVGCAVLLAAAAIWLIPDSSPTTASPDGSAPLQLPSSPLSSSITPPPIPGYIATELPPGFALNQVGNRDAASNYDRQAGYFELWAQPNTTRTEGRWFAAVASNGGVNQDVHLSPTTPVVVHDSVALYRESGDGIAEIVWENPVSLAGLEVVGHGFTADEFVTIANSIQELATAPTSIHPDTELRFGGTFDPRAVGFNRIISTPTWSPEIANQPSAPTGQYAIYNRAGSSSIGFSVNTTAGSQRAPADLVMAVHRFLSSAATDPPPVPPALASRGPVQLLESLGSQYFLGGSEVMFRSIEWVDAGVLVTVVGNVSFSELVSAASSVRPASATEWADLLAP